MQGEGSDVSSHEGGLSLTFLEFFSPPLVFKANRQPELSIKSLNREQRLRERKRRHTTFPREVKESMPTRLVT